MKTSPDPASEAPLATMEDDGVYAPSQYRANGSSLPRAYTRPILTVYGRLSELTQTGANDVADSFISGSVQTG